MSYYVIKFYCVIEFLGGSIRADDIDYITRFLPQGLFSYAGWKAYKWSGLRSSFKSLRYWHYVIGHYVIRNYVISHYAIRLFLKEKSEFSSKILITAGVTYASLYIFERLRSVF